MQNLRSIGAEGSYESREKYIFPLPLGFQAPKFIYEN